MTWAATLLQSVTRNATGNHHGASRAVRCQGTSFQADVSNEQSLQSAFDRAKSALGKLDGIAIATWIAIDKPLVSQGWEEVNKLFQVNVGEARDRVRCRARAIRRVSVRSSRRRWLSSRYKTRARLVAWS